MSPEENAASAPEPAADALPLALADLRDWLATQGYRIDDRRNRLRYPYRGQIASLTNRVLTCTHGPCIVRFLSDRHSWVLEVFGADFSSPSYSAAMWQALLQGHRTPLAAHTLAEEAAVLREVLPEIEAALAAIPEIETRLWRSTLAQKPPPTTEILVQAGFPADSPRVSELLDNLVSAHELARANAPTAALPASTYRPPAGVERFWSWLEEQRFRREEVYSPQNFGDRLLSFSRESVVLLFTRDMGLWSVRVWGELVPANYGVELWAACLAGQVGALALPPLSELNGPDNMHAASDQRILRDVEWLRQVLPVLEEQVRRDPEGTLLCLRQRAEERFQRRYLKQ